MQLMKTFRWVMPLALIASAALLTSDSVVVAQLGPCAVATGPLRPDLIVDGHLMKAQMVLSEESYGPNSCALLEGCITSAGTHLVLRFTSSTPNIGQADLVIGNPSNCPNLFRLSECHQHLHFEEYADYRLWTVAGYDNWVANRDLTQPTNVGTNQALLTAARASGDLIVGRKQGFCIIDVAPFQFGNVQPGPPRYRSCSQNQGLKVGWTDQYVFLLDCQFVQMTGVAEGDYVLEDHVNPEQLFPESSYTNNTAAVRFHFRPKQGRIGPSFEIIN